MAAKGHGLFRYLRDPGKGHDLEAPGVRQDGAIPAHEPVQAAQALQPLGSGPQHQVIGIAEDDVGPGGLHLVHGQGLDRGCGPHRHEGGGADLAPGGVQDTRARRTVPGGDVKGKGAHPALQSRLASP